MDSKKHLIVLQFNRWTAVLFVHFQQVTLTPNVVTFTINVFAICLAFLFPKLLLVFLDPVDLGNGIDTDGVDIHPLGRRDTDPSRRWMHAQVNILDLLEDDIHRDAADLDLFSIHAVGR